MRSSRAARELRPAARVQVRLRSWFAIILCLQLMMDGHGGDSSLGGCDDRELRLAGSVTGEEQPSDVSPHFFVRRNRPVGFACTTQVPGQAGSLHLFTGKENSVAFKCRSLVEFDDTEASARVLFQS